MKKFGQKAGMPFGVEYRESPLPQEWDAAYIYIQPAMQLACLLGSQREAPVYQYLITWGQENGYGPVHIIDTPLLFGDENTWKKSMLTRGIAWPEVLRDGRQVREGWGSFARTGRIADPLNLPGLLRCRRI